MEWLSKTINELTLNPEAPECVTTENPTEEQEEEAEIWCENNDLFVPPSIEKIKMVENEMFEKVWLVRSFNCLIKEQLGEMEKPPKQIDKERKAAVKETLKKYNISKKDVENMSDWDYGNISGWMAALRWVLTGLDEGLYDS